MIYEPVKFGYLKGRIFVEIHQDIYSKIPDILQYAIKKLQERNLSSRINWAKFLQAVEEQKGAPVEISRASAAAVQSSPGAQ